jgi:hypothetical protein
MHNAMTETMSAGRGRARHSLSPVQVAAVRTVMDDCATLDRRRGYTARQRIHCDVCGHPRPRPGFVAYGEDRCCNRCATRRELARLAGILDATA